MEDTQKKKLDISVLFVEDELPVREKISQILTREVRKLYLAGNGKEGLEQFGLHAPDMVITDIRMPVMNGLDMAEEIKASGRHTPVVVTTAHGEADYLIRAIEIGIDRFLLKPVDLGKLSETIRTIAENIRTSKELKQTNKLLEEYKNAVDESNIVCKTDANGKIIYVNDEFCKISGYQRTELLGQKHDAILHLEKQESVLKNLQATITSKKIWKGVLEHRRKNHISYFADVTIVPLLGMDECINEFIYIGHNITELIALTKKLNDLSNTDALTQIYNRMAFNNILETELIRAKRYRTDLSLIMFDIDHFKNVNDTYGHMIGDEVLKTIVEIISGSIRTIDFFARWGGEEFMILLPETNSEAALELAERLRVEIASYNFKTAGRVTASFGVASLKDDVHADALATRVDNALYMSKNNGRNRVAAG